MKAKEPAVRYNTMPSISVMRGKLIEVFEHENDANFIQSMYVFMIQTRNEQEAEKNTKHSLSELKGILALGDGNENQMSYEDMRKAYVKDRFSL